MARARLIFSDRRRYDDGAIMMMRILEVPSPVHPSTHLLKYSLFYGYPGRRLVLYDNERGKGDHKHVKGKEENYRFVSAERLIEDFFADVLGIRGSL
jgi:Family of unknown function (DUF6516)